MTRQSCLLAAVVAAVVVSAQPVLGHHGGAAFDQTKSVTMEGTVTELTFANPHVLVFFDVKNGEGDVVKWSGWLTAPNKLARAGWTKRTLVAGDHVTITGTPHKDGNHVIQIRRLIGPDSKALPLSEN